MSIKFSFQKGLNQPLELIFRGVMVINMQQNKAYFVPDFPSNSMKKRGNQSKKYRGLNGICKPPENYLKELVNQIN